VASGPVVSISNSYESLGKEFYPHRSKLVGPENGFKWFFYYYFLL